MNGLYENSSMDVIVLLSLFGMFIIHYSVNLPWVVQLLPGILEVGVQPGEQEVCYNTTPSLLPLLPSRWRLTPLHYRSIDIRLCLINCAVGPLGQSQNKAQFMILCHLLFLYGIN